MKLWTISADRSLWKTHLAEWTGALHSRLLYRQEYSEAECAAFRTAAEEFVLTDNYFFFSEDSYTENGGRSTIYHALDAHRLLICDSEVVGILLITCHESTEPPVETVYHADALFFHPENSAQDGHQEKACTLQYALWEGEHREYHSCELQLVRRNSFITPPSLLRIPLPNLV